MNKPIIKARVIRWLLLLQEFDIRIIDKRGKDNVFFNFVPQLTNEGKAIPIEDHFPDEHLFAISTNSPWYANIANYLVVGKLPYHFSPKENKYIIKKSSRFSWIGGYLFHTSLDLIIWRCVRDYEIYDILKACHD